MTGDVPPSLSSSFWEYAICPSCRLLIHSSSFIDPLSFMKCSICTKCMSDLRKRYSIETKITPSVQNKRTHKRSKRRMKNPSVVPQSSWRVVYPPFHHQKSAVCVAKLIHHPLYH